MATVFWDIEEVILVDFMPKGTTINSDVYIDTLRKLKARLRRVRPPLDMFKVLLQHDNARPHTSLKTRELHVYCGMCCFLSKLYVQKFVTQKTVMQKTLMQKIMLQKCINKKFL